MPDAVPNNPELPLASSPSSPPAVETAPSVALADLTAAGIPETFIKDGKFDAKALAASLTEGQTLKQQMEERAKGVPADGAYVFELPKDIQVPQGYEWKPDPTFTAEVAALAKKEGLTQAQVSELTRAYAVQDLRKMQTAQAANAEATKAEMAKLGADAPKRLDTVGKAAIATFGERLGKALINSSAFADADTVIALEAFINEQNSKMAARTTTDAKPNSELTELLGKPGAGRKFLEAAHAVKH